jgi:hypothetical protein
MLFLTYNDMSGRYDNSIHNLQITVSIHEPKFKFVNFLKNHLDHEFVEKNSRILSMPRGGGYWLWKPYAIYNTLLNANDGETVLYLDSMYLFTEPFMEGLFEFRPNELPLVIFKNKAGESEAPFRMLCKKHVIVKYGVEKAVDEDIPEVWAGCICVKKTPETLEFIKKWLDMCQVYEDITDSPSTIPNEPYFNDHRHDQALLTVLCYMRGIVTRTLPKRYLQNIRSPF